MGARKQLPKGLERKGAHGESDTQQQVKRIVIVNHERCKPNTQAFQYLKKHARGCGRECIMVKSKFGGKNGKETREYIHVSELACHACLNRAKRTPGGAVKVVNLPSNLNKDVTHRYGQNGFKLHRLPTPRAGCVVGLLGKNGIGKSTAINILAGRLKPNLGRFDNPPTWADIITYYRGSDLQQYLTRLVENDMRVVRKVQLDHDYVRKLEGKVVRELLEEHDQRRVSAGLIVKLELEAVLEREVQTLSGGELQRFAVAMVCSQDADVYMFDECSSFLDIKQRMTVTECIQNLLVDDSFTGKSGTSKYVVVVEHDLAVLDYMSDYVCCMYGEPGAYGVVTKVATTTCGINNYLSGYFPAENLRFRAEEISFHVSSACSSGDALLASASFASVEDVLGEIKYPAVTKTLTQKSTGSTFTLHIEGGSFRACESIGLLGQNGCGKTTFMNILAGNINTDESKPPRDLEGKDIDGFFLSGIGVSYKKQVYAPELRKFQGTVADLFEQELQNMCADHLFKLLVMKPLGLEDIHSLDTNTLSGGELQRVAIALCLGKPANVYLLDEPSAGLDCEHRVIAAKVIRRWILTHLQKTCFIIEHDFVMASALADRVVVYEGTPGVECYARTAVDLSNGFNSFLAQLSITLRRDPINWRPRVNKRGSQLDTEQKTSGNLFVFDKDIVSIK